MERLIFLEGRKSKNPEKNPRTEQGENKLNPHSVRHYIVRRNQTQTTLVGFKELSPQ